MADWKKCVICQEQTREALRRPFENPKKEISQEIVEGFLQRASRISALGGPSLNILSEHLTFSTLKTNLAKWHKSCFVKFSHEKLQRWETKSRSAEDAEPELSEPSSSHRARRSDSTKESCIFCKKDKKDGDLIIVQKLELTEEIRRKALDLQDAELQAEIALGDLVARDAKYHKRCMTSFMNRHRSFIRSAQESEEVDDRIEQVLASVDSALADGQTAFPLSELLNLWGDQRAEVRGCADESQAQSLNRSRLKRAVLERFPELQEQKGFRNSVILVTRKEMKRVVCSSVEQNVSTEDQRIISQAALVLRREMRKISTSYDYHTAGFTGDDGLPKILKTFVSLLLKGPRPIDVNIQWENPDQTLVDSLSQILAYNITLSKKSRRDFPVPLYIGLMVHTSLRNKGLVEELSKLGVCVTYGRVKYVEKVTAQRVIKMAEVEGVLVPCQLRKNLFTFAAVDNIDHNPSSTTAKDSFHGTAISVFQSRKDFHEGIVRDMPIDVPCSKKVKLPTQYAFVPPLQRVVPKNIVVPPTSVPCNNELYSDMDTEKTKELAWAKAEDLVPWSVFHSQGKEGPIPDICSVLPVFTESSNDTKMLMHTMRLVIATTEFLNPGQISILCGDQPLFAKMKMLQWTIGDLKEGKIVLMLGGFHIEKAFLACIGQFLTGSGWTEKLSEAGVAKFGVAESCLHASHVTRTRYCHQVTYVALRKLQSEATGEMTGPTVTYWNLILRCEEILFAFVRAIRDGDFKLYITSLEAMVPFFFAAGRVNYARWLPIHLRDMQNLPPSVLSEFKAGRFVVGKSARRFSRIAIDQAHEQNNKDLKGPGGIIGLSENKSSMHRWQLVGPEVLRTVSEFRSLHLDSVLEDDCFHHDENLSRMRNFDRDVRNLVDSIGDVNPFMESLNALVTLDGSRCIEEAVEDVKEVEESGKKMYEEFKKSVIHGKLPVNTPIKRTKTMQLYKEMPKKPRPKQVLKIAAVQEQLSVFGRVYMVADQRGVEKKEFFRHEITAFPPSLSEGSKLFHGKKSDIVPCLIEIMQSEQKPAPVWYDATVLDASILAHTVNPSGCSTFQDYFETRFMPAIKKELLSSERVDLVFDRYLVNSLKTETREGRGQGKRCKVASSQRLPRLWSDFLRNSGNKNDLFHFFATKILEQEQSFNPHKAIYSTKGPGVIHIGKGQPMDGKTSQEEADTRIVLHAVRFGSVIVVKSVDSDILTILLGVFDKILETNEGAEVWFQYGNETEILVNDLYESLGSVAAKALPFFTAATGCDTTSSMRGHGKKSCWARFFKDGELLVPDLCKAIEPFLEDLPNADIVEDCEVFQLFQSFIVSIYGGRPNQTLEDLRMQKFAKHQRVERLPPTRGALLQHLKRALLQMSTFYFYRNQQTYKKNRRP